MNEQKNKIIFLESERIYLRPTDIKNDIHFFLQWLNDQSIGENLSQHQPFTFEKEERYLLERDKNENCFHFSIVIKEEDKLIGAIGLNDVNWINRNSIEGLFIGDKNYWGKGYGTESIKLLLKYGFKTLNLHKIIATVFAFNERSLRCHLKSGFVQEGIQRKQQFKNGQYHDVILLGILQEEFTG